MSIIDDHQLVRAYFINQQRADITVELLHPSNENSPDNEINIFLYTFPADEKNPDYISLLKKVTIDDVYENTVNKFRNERERFELEVMKIAKESNEFATIIAERGSIDFINSVVTFLEKDFSEEDLFKFKLNLFETETVQKSKAKTKKANLRKSTTAKEAFKIFLDF